MLNVPKCGGFYITNFFLIKDTLRGILDDGYQHQSLTAEALIKAYGKMDQASFYQLVYGAAIMTDKARLLAGESTQNVEVHTTLQVEGLDKLCEMLSQSLMQHPTSENEGK
jgi:hypothetical protein